MKIAVCVKQVPEGTGGSLRLDPSTKRQCERGTICPFATGSSRTVITFSALFGSSAGYA